LASNTGSGSAAAGWIPKAWAMAVITRSTTLPSCVPLMK
jgi:hypothetical protein